MYYKLDRVRTFIFIYFVAFLLYNAFVLWLIEISYEPSYIGEDGNFFFWLSLLDFYEKYLNYYQLSYQCLQIDKLSPLFFFFKFNS